MLKVPSQLNTDYGKLNNRVNLVDGISCYSNYSDTYVGSKIVLPRGFVWHGVFIRACVGSSWNRQTVALFLISCWYENHSELFKATKLHEQYYGAKYDISITTENNKIVISTGDQQFAYYSIAII